MVNFMKQDDEKSRWQNIMDNTKEKLNSIWSGRGTLPDRDNEE